MKHIVLLKKSHALEDFEKEGNNIVSLHVQDISGNNITNDCKVQLTISKNGLLGLGKELIRYAYEPNKEGHHWHLDPARPNTSLVQTLGIFLAPQSIEPIIGYAEHGKINQALNIKTHGGKTEDKYEITIPREFGHIEDYTVADDNIACFNVFDKQGNDITDQIRYITIFLSKNAMLGLGTELIRLAHNFKEGKEIHIIPASIEKGAEQSMGIFLTPDSCEFTIRCEHFESIEKYLEEYKKKHK